MPTTATKERPSLFSGPMVQAILNGQKTQTRRIVKCLGGVKRGDQWTGPANPVSGNLIYRDGGAWDSSEGFAEPIAKSPYGVVGDRLWVRETARLIEDSDELDFAVNFADMEGFQKVRVRYEVDGTESDWLPYPSRLKPLQVGKCIPNGCYREAARLFLEITGVRVERLHDISNEDAIAEGVERLTPPGEAAFFRNYLPHDIPSFMLPSRSFMSLWESINGPGSWAANPWVWVYDFRRLEAE